MVAQWASSPDRSLGTHTGTQSHFKCHWPEGRAHTISSTRHTHTDTLIQSQRAFSLPSPPFLHSPPPFFFFCRSGLEETPCREKPLGWCLHTERKKTGWKGTVLTITPHNSSLLSAFTWLARPGGVMSWSGSDVVQIVKQNKHLALRAVTCFFF